MIYNSRPLSEYEIEAWAEYNRVVDSIPGARWHDSVSTMKAFPKVQEAFDRAVKAKMFYELTKDYDDE